VNNLQIPLSEATNFPALFIDFINQKLDLKDFYGNFADLEGFKNQISNKKFDHRDILVEVLNDQYKGARNRPEINKLAQKNTFTVTTGHQLNIFTGPLYVIYKIVSTINLAKKLKENFPVYDFVPVYWMATEDHDFEEISYFNLFGNKYQWQTEQTGAVGRMKPQEVLGAIEGLTDKHPLFVEAYSSQETLTQAVRMYMHELFGAEGLICIDGDDARLKKLFAPFISDDIFRNSAEKIVAETTSKLENLGYKTQIFARNINFFYLADGVRTRLSWEGENIIALGTDLKFTREEIENLIATKPELFSPNVVLRPLYQETILPNLAYLGGPSEVAYWLQLPAMFKHYDTLFPILMPRNFALIVNGGTAKKIEKLGLEVIDLFKEDNELKKYYVAKNSKNTLSLEAQNKVIETAFEDIVTKALAVDPTLKAVVEAEKIKVLAAVQNLEKRLKKQEEKKYETALLQIENLKSKLFPGGGLQERTDNFLNFYQNDSAFINKLYPAFDPLTFSFNVIFV
jgi:bacillithiol synthase